MLDSDSLEMNYQENPSGQMKFKTSGNDYMMDFQRMVQKNVIHKTERDVRRRPVFVNFEEIGIRKKRYFDHIEAYDYRGVWVNRKVCGGGQVLEVEQIEKWREWQVLG